MNHDDFDKRFDQIAATARKGFWAALAVNLLVVGAVIGFLVWLVKTLIAHFGH